MPDIPAGIVHVIDSDAALNLPSRPENIAKLDTLIGNGGIRMKCPGWVGGIPCSMLALAMVYY
ncbi:hypothetical protein E2562_037011 [Oryza meyeriana var. granulata]|uniref:Uncharacterized protein n=1 Tax=Oryza meyeriana var. granulata TaxID=110450 RepID=A0A6G1CXE2_9ORYZ|nr:hypothetical protein E2562_037011 [Oryza meyeriana var. granulata]